MRIALGILFLLHGLAHLVFFIAPWGLAGSPELAPASLLSGTVDLGAGGARALGLIWLLGAVAFGAAAIGAFLRAGWWRRVAVTAAAASLVLSVLGWPGAMVGVPVNLAILAVLGAARFLGWRKGELSAG